MVVVMQEGATEEQVQRVINRLMDMGFDIHRSTGARQTVLGAVGAKVGFDTRDIELLAGVAEVLRISAPYKLASRQFRPEGSVIQLGKGVAIGGKWICVMAGPCSVESAEQIDTIAAQVAAQLGLRGSHERQQTHHQVHQRHGQLRRRTRTRFSACAAARRNGRDPSRRPTGAAQDGHHRTDAAVLSTPAGARFP